MNMRIVFFALIFFAETTHTYAVEVEQPSLSTQTTTPQTTCCCLCHKPEAQAYNPASCPCHQTSKKLTKKELWTRFGLFAAGLAVIPCVCFVGYHYARKIFIARMTKWIDDEINNAAHNGVVTPEIKKIIRFLYDAGCFVHNASRFIPAESVSLEKLLDHYAQSLEPF